MADTAPEDWPARLRALVYEQYKLSNWAIPLADAIAKQRGQLAGLNLAFLFLWSIDTITDDTASPAYGIGRGVQLDRIGKLVGQQRGAATDAEYRPILRARVLANRSNGAADVAMRVFLAMFAGDGAPLYTPGWVAQYTLRLVGVLMDPLIVPAAMGLLAAATQGGNRAVLEWTTVEPDEVLTCNDVVAFGALGVGQAIGDADNPTRGGRMGGAQST
jgi:hypothetical protein